MSASRSLPSGRLTADPAPQQQRRRCQVSVETSAPDDDQAVRSSRTVPLELALTVRDVGPEDLVDLEWSGGPSHLTALAEAMQRGFADETALLMVTAPNGVVVAVGGVDFTRRPSSGDLWMLSVRGGWQSLGVGSILIAELEHRVRSRGLPQATLSVEHDNPRAEALYRRLGYVRTGTELDSWPIGQGRSYATVCFTMAKKL
jgi:ribosomal protein S18 acetylase RimI-like enzyme